MLAKLVKSLDQGTLLDPSSTVWKKAQGEKTQLVGTPVGLQPTDYIRTKWENQPPGKVSQVEVKAMHNGQMLAFHLKWKDETDNSALADTTGFPDGAAIAIGTTATPSFTTMGTAEEPINVWYWRADANDSGRQVTAAGIGTTETLGEGVVRAKGERTRKGWKVVIARNLKVAEQAMIRQLDAGDRLQIAVAIWEGGSAERGGLKSFSPVPIDLELAGME